MDKRRHTDSRDDARLLPHLRDRARLSPRLELERTQRRILREERARAHTEGRDTTMPTRIGAAGGDPVQLRGIPAIGRTVGGAIRQTQPEQAVVHQHGDWTTDHDTAA
jgi:hypothetical protein